jgi:myosin-crossreactive antigen
LAKATVLWNAKISYVPTSDFSLFTLQRWSERPIINPTLSVQIAFVQKMFEKSKWSLTSQYSADAIRIGSLRAQLTAVSTISAKTDIHEIEDHNKTQKHLRGSLTKRLLKAGMAAPVLEGEVP